MSLPTTTDCPPITDLERLLRGRLSEARTTALTEHIGGCHDCQQRLESLTAPAHGIAEDLRDFTRNTPPSDSAYWKALAAAEENLRATAALAPAPADPASADPASAGELRLDFLQPCQEPGRIGKLGRFGILRVIGRGGMGVVLYAHDPHLDRDVAVKVIDPRLADNEVARQRFCREARSAAAVTHENLVAVYQVDEDEASGLPYLVMQLVSGESLEQRLRRVGPLSVTEVARLGMQAAAGLAAAHAGGLIHRDIKPANILLEAGTDRVKLTDFGLAYAAEDVKLTRSGFIAGSPLYMAPEQARGEAIDYRADLFSLGSVLYEAAVGHPPFEAKTPLAVLRRICDDTPPPLHKVNPAIPRWLSQTVERLLAKNPDDRYQSASEVAETFAAALAREHALSPLDLPASACAAAGRSGHAPQARHLTRWKSLLCRGLPWLGGAALGAFLLGLLWSPEPVERVVRVEVPAPPAPPPEPGPAPRAVFPGESGALWAVTFLPGDRLALGAEDGSVKITDLRRASVLKTLEPRQNGTAWSLDVSADGKFLAATCDDSRVTVWNLETFAVTYSFPQPTSTKAAVFNPDGSKLATGDRNSTIRLWDIAAEIPTPLLGHRGTVNALAFSPDGSRLASAGSDGTVKVWHLDDTTADPMTLDLHKGPVYGVAFGPDGSRLATTGWDGTVRIWDAHRGTQVQTIKAHDGDSWSVSFGHDGQTVASGGSDGFVRVWEVESGRELFSYRTGRAVHVVRFAKDGTTLAAGGRDGTLRVWDVK